MSRRDLLIAKLSDTMDPDQAVALVTEVLHEHEDAPSGERLAQLLKEMQMKVTLIRHGTYGNERAIATLVEHWADELEAALSRTQAAVPSQVQVSRDLLVRADSYLSLLWYRPSTEHDTDLQIEVPKVIGELRAAYERNR
jgi:hypothetical protein